MQSLYLQDAVAESSTNVSLENGSALRSNVWLTLHTRFAQLLVRGRDVKSKPPIIGLLGFADRLRVIWYASQANDPYADWWLIKIHDALAAIDSRLQKERDVLMELFQVHSAFRVVPTEDKESFRIQLRFASPYAYRAAQTLATFDLFVRETLTAKHVGLLNAKEAKSNIHSVATKIRGVFNIPSRYRHLSIDRTDPSSWEGHGEIALRFMGELPDDVRKGTRRAAFAPPILRDRNGFVPPLLEEIAGFDGLDSE